MTGDHTVEDLGPHRPVHYTLLHPDTADETMRVEMPIRRPRLLEDFSAHLVICACKATGRITASLQRTE